MRMRVIRNTRLPHEDSINASQPVKEREEYFGNAINPRRECKIMEPIKKIPKH